MSKGQLKHKQAEQRNRERGCWLTGWLVVIALSGIASAYMIYYLRAAQYQSALVWVVPTLFALAIADIVAVIGIWYWKRWGLVLYAVSIAASIAVGLIVTAAQLVVFTVIIPFVILGYLIKPHWGHFD
jgi:hypothetical protein